MPTPVKAAVVGLAGTMLSSEEEALFSSNPPLGIILFKRNIENPDQLRRLLDQCRSVLNENTPLFLIDQEGGRVDRLGPPHWPKLPPAAQFGELGRQDLAAAAKAAELQGRIIAGQLLPLGFNVNCAPCLDLTHPETHSAIGDRSFSDDPLMVIKLGRALVTGLLAGGVLPVIKHLPGHGRARIDSHFEMPEITTDQATLTKSDFLPFQALYDLPFGMTGHLLFRDIDSRYSATISSTIIGDIIRGAIGFDGFLFSDDLCMQALKGTPGDRANASLAAGVDCALHCNGVLEDTADVLRNIDNLSDAAEARLASAFQAMQKPISGDITQLTKERDDLLGIIVNGL